MRNKRIFTSLLLVLIMVLSVFLSNGKIVRAAGMEGEGTEVSPYLIRTANDLYSISENPTAYYELINDLDLLNIERKPIKIFSGVLNGNGYTIKNLKVRGDYGVGLFQEVNKATIKNTTLKSPDIYGISMVGSLCGQMYNSNIINCYSIDGKVEGYNDTVGGLIGTIEKCNIYQCYSNNKAVVKFQIAGGLIGSTDDSSNTIITQCFTECEVTGQEYIGGILGYVYDERVLKMQNCYSISKINDLSSEIAYPSGIASGQNGGGVSNLDNCYAVSQIDSSNKVGLNAFGTATNSYFDKTVLGLDTPYEQARTTEQMYQKSNYVGWDFENV